MKHLVWLLFSIIVCVACTAPAVSTPTPTPAALATPSATVVEPPTSIPASGSDSTWQKYTNEQVGFSIQYPANWQGVDQPDDNQSPLHHKILNGPEGGVDLMWGSGLGGGCPDGYQPLAVAQSTWPACLTQKEDGTEVWSLAGQVRGEITFAGMVYTHDSTPASRAIVLQVISTLSFP